MNMTGGIQMYDLTERFPQDLSVYDSGLGIPEAYDPEFRFSTLSRFGSIEVQIRKLCEQIEDDPNALQQISLIVPTWRQGRDGVGISHPMMIECGGSVHTGFSHGTCMLIGDADGYQAPGRDVVRVLRSDRPNGQHAMVRIRSGNLFAVGFRKDNKNQVLAIYRVDDTVNVPQAFFDLIDKYKADRNNRPLKVSSEQPMAINATLMSVALISPQGVHGWDRPGEDGQPPLDLQFMQEAVLRKLGGESYEPIFIERFYDVQPPRKKKGRFNLAPGQGVITSTTAPDDFVAVLTEEVVNYRRQLLAAEHKEGRHPLPLLGELSYVPDTTDVQLTVTLPRQLDKEHPAGTDAVQITTTLVGGAVPDSLKEHCSLTAGAVESEELHAVLSQVPEGYHACQIYLLTHA